MGPSAILYRPYNRDGFGKQHIDIVFDLAGAKINKTVTSACRARQSGAAVRALLLRSVTLF
jgi:hypothetical protein